MEFFSTCGFSEAESDAHPLGMWMTEATPEADKANACSPVLRNALSSPVHGELEDNFEGCATAWEIIERSFSKFKDNNAVGERALLKREMEPDAKSGKSFEKLTLAGEYEWMTYGALGERVAAFAAGLAATAGVGKGARVLIFAETQRDWMVTALACWRQGATVVTAYATLGEEGVSTSSSQTGATVCVCDAKLFKILAKAAPDCKGLKLVIPIVPEGCEDTAGTPGVEDMQALLPKGVTVTPFGEVVAAGAKAPCAATPPAPADHAVIMYTSGTTGGSKGVMITHRNIAAMVASNCKVMGFFGAKDSYLAYLPLAHIMELETEVWILGLGASMGYGSPHTLTDTGVKLKQPGGAGDAPTLKPTTMLFAPAVLDKVYAAVQRKLDSPLKKYLFDCALTSGYRSYAKGGVGAGAVYNAVLMKKVQALIGGRVTFMGTGSAPLSPDIQKFVQTVFNCPVRQGYGCTETCGGSVIAAPADNTVSQVGPPTGCTYIRLRDWPEGNYLNADVNDPAIRMRRGEVLIGGPSITDGYLVDGRAPDAELVKKNKEDFVEIEGVRYFCTGDVGQVTPNGTLQIVDRKKDLFKGASGEYVALSKVEAALKLCPYVEMPMAYGKTGKATVIGLICPQKPNILELAAKKGLGDDFVALCKNADIVAEVSKELKAFCKKGGLLPFETPTAFALVVEDDGTPAWTPDNDLLTSTMKLKRPIIAKKHEAEIEDCYARS